MADPHTQKSSRSSAKSKRELCIAQTTADSLLHAAYNDSVTSGDLFDYSKSVDVSSGAVGNQLPSAAVPAYLHKMVRGGITQSFGCMLAVEVDTFKVLALSANTVEILNLSPQAGPTPAVDIGTDVRTIFTAGSVSVLEKATSSRDLALMNPLSLQAKVSNNSFYAILHRIDVGLVMDLEPVRPTDGSVSAAGVLQTNKLAAKAISRLQALPGGDIGALCNTVVEEVRELTGYDRVMAYKFHEDDHGEVIAETRRSDLDSYLGLHYPATDIPQAARFLFLTNRVRMICDCNAEPVQVKQDERLKKPISLARSCLRGVHACHPQYMANMGSLASLVMAVVMKDPENPPPPPSSPAAPTPAAAAPTAGRRLWGLVVCHHTRPRHVSYPLRSACEFLMQVVGLHLNMEVELGRQVREKNILRTQSLLCNMLLRDVPLGIVSKSPNICDLVRCDGAALLYRDSCRLLGVTPSEAQVRDIRDWLTERHKDSTGLSTESLTEAGYPQADGLGVRVCGMAAARITEKDFVFWFRSHAEKDIKWAGAQQEGREKDDPRKMHPRSSFAAFLEVVKKRSAPWEGVEMDAIHSLQLILRTAFADVEQRENKALIYEHFNQLKLKDMDELGTVASEMVRLIETANAPILAVDVTGAINGWNTKVAKLTGLPAAKATGLSLMKDVVHPDSIQTAERLIHLAINGEEVQIVELQLRRWGGSGPQTDFPVILVVNTCASRGTREAVVGVCFVGQDVTVQKTALNNFTRLQGDYTTIVQARNSIIPPIFGVDECGYCSEWNPAIERLTGLEKNDVVGRTVAGDVFGVGGMCPMKNADDLTKFMIVLSNAIGGQDVDKLPFTFMDRNGKTIDALISTNKRVDGGGEVMGVFCFLHTASPDLQQALAVQKSAGLMSESKAKEVAYIREEVKKPLNGIEYARSLILCTHLTEKQQKVVGTSAACEQQLRRILEDRDVESIDGGQMRVEVGEFTVGGLINSVVSQGLLLVSKKGLQLHYDTHPHLSSLRCLGDAVRLQQVLAEFLLNAINFTPRGGWVEIKVVQHAEGMLQGGDVAKIEFRVTHAGNGIPEDLIQQMFDSEDTPTKYQEGLGLSMCRKIVWLMSGEVKYIREQERCYFELIMDLPLAVRDL